jgi:hypothetical protein
MTPCILIESGQTVAIISSKISVNSTRSYCVMFQNIRAAIYFFLTSLKSTRLYGNKEQSNMSVKTPNEENVFIVSKNE